MIDSIGQLVLTPIQEARKAVANSSIAKVVANLASAWISTPTGKTDRNDESSDDSSTTEEKFSDDDDDVKAAVKSCDEYDAGGLSSNSNSSRKDQCSIRLCDDGPTSRSIDSKVSDGLLARFAKEELKLKKFRRQDGTSYWKEGGKARFDDIEALRRYCKDNIVGFCEYLEAVNQAGIDRIVTPNSTVTEIEAWKLLSKKGWKCVTCKALGSRFTHLYISPDFEQLKLGKVVCKSSGTEGTEYLDFFFVRKDAKKVLWLQHVFPELFGTHQNNNVLKERIPHNQKSPHGKKGGQDKNERLRSTTRVATNRKRIGKMTRKATAPKKKTKLPHVKPCLKAKVKSSSSDEVRQTTTTTTTGSSTVMDEHIEEETDEERQGSPHISPLLHALLPSDNASGDDAWMVDIPGLRGLDPDGSDFVSERNAYVCQHEQFYRSQHSEKEEEEEEDEGNEYFDGIESQKVKQMGEGYTSDIESTGRKRSLKERRSRNTVSDYSWPEVWDYLWKKHQWTWIRSPSDLCLKGSWVYLRAGVIRGHPGRGAPPLITADTLEPAKEGLHFFMNPQDVMQYIEEKAHPDIKLGLHDNKEGKAVFSGPCHHWVNEPHHGGGPTPHDYEGHLYKFLKDKKWSPAVTRREYHEYLFQDKVNESRGAIASGADRSIKRQRTSNLKHGLTDRSVSAPKGRSHRRKNKYASVRSVNNTETMTEVGGKHILSRDEKRKKHEMEYPPPVDVSSDRAFELVSSLPQTNEHATKFPLWRSTLLFGWSLGLCGVGSKTQLLDDFIRRELSREANGTKILTVRAFMGSKISFILTSLCRCIMGQATADITIRSDPLDHADTILAAYDKALQRRGFNPQFDDEITGFLTHNGVGRREFLENTGKGVETAAIETLVEEREQKIRTVQVRECALRSGLTAAVPPRIFLAIHNIDAVQLRDRRSQEALGMVAKHPRIHLIATTDHVNAALLWDDELRGPGYFHWQWEHAPTHDRYDEELRYISGADVSSAAKMAHGLNFVLESITNKHLIIAKTLARSILKMGPEVQQADRGMRLQDLFDMCRNELFLQRAQNLNSYIKVLEDNNIVSLGKHPTYGLQWLTMPQTREALLCIDKFGQIGG